MVDDEKVKTIEENL